MSVVSKLVWYLSVSVTVLILLVFPFSANAQNGITRLPDLNGDGKSDLLWNNPANGQTVAWVMDGTSAISSAALLADPAWKLIKTADLNGDGNTDLIVYNASTGQTVAWLMNGTTVTGWTLLLAAPDWKVIETADFNGDGKTDLLWYNAALGQTAVWLMNGTSTMTWTVLLTDADWKVIATADLNGDGKADLLWYNASLNQTAVWLMNGTNAMTWTVLLTAPDWKIAATADFNGDGKADLLWYNATIGQTAMWLMNGASTVSWTALPTDPNWKVAATADFNGDGKADIVFNNTLTGQKVLWMMNGSSISGSASLLTSLNWNVVAATDLNNDGKADLLWYNSSTGQTAAWLMSGTSATSGANLFTDPNWRLQCIKGASVTTTIACDDSVATIAATAAMPVNQAPIVNAGADLTITLPATANLAGNASDDGAPIALLISAWSQVSGPGTVTFGNPANLQTTAAFSVAGTYTLRLTSTDSMFSTSDDVVVTVGAAGSTPTNKAPVVNAGPDQITTLSAGANLLGSVSDDGLPNGSTLTKTWSSVSGPGTVTFGNASSVTTTATFSVAGTYTLRLTANDSLLSSSDDVIITVNATSSTNQAPVVNAGPDQMITFPTAATLAGSANDDGLPSGSTLTRTWSKVSGPGTVTFGNASSLSTTATFSVTGSYTLRLTASDSVLTSSDDVVIVVSPAPTNQAPVVNAGADKSIVFPAGTTLSGTANDDGLPSGSTLTVSWSKVSGPGTVVFVNANSLNASATFTAAGTYTLRLTASDSLLTATDDVIITVAPPANQAPVVNAGPDQIITLPAAANLAGTATDDGLPTGSTLTRTWSKVSGPGTVTFGNSSALNTTATFSASGSYTLRLTVSDGSLSTSDDVTITINASGTTGQTYYVDQTSGNDSNNGSQSAPWKNAPGMTACSSVCASTTINPGTTIYFDRADTWLVSGQYGIHVKGGVSYIGDEWGSGTGKAIIRASSALAAAVIDFREDHPTIPTIVKGFDVDANGTVTNGVGFNMPFYTSPLTGATKRVENLNVHNTWSRTSLGQYTYGISVSNHGGTQATVKNVEILNSVVHDTSRDGLVLYPGDEDANCIIQNILVRGNEVYNTGQDPDYGAGSGIVAKGRVIDAFIENNYVHDIPKANLIFVNGNETNHFGFGPSNIHIRYNLLNANNMGQGAIMVYDGASGSDPKDVKIYGNLVYATTYNSSKLGGLWLDSGLGNTNTLLVYNNTFYNAPVTINNSAATFPTFEFKNNIVYQTTGTAITGSSKFTAASNNITTNPSFKNVSNPPTGFSGSFGVDLAPNTDGFSVLSGSTAIDAGTALAATYNLSINSLTRAQGSVWDIGAYESAGTTSAPTNQVPVVNAGPDQTITLPASATLSGSATDDGLPTGSTLAKSWSAVSGPGTVTFGNAAALSTTATFSMAGTYTLRLSATDGALSASDDVVITVNAAPPVNLAPVVNAGPDFTITLPNGITLAGSATDDGLPTGSTLTKSWSKVSGPGTVTFGNAAALNSTASFSAAGTYTLRLTASDSLLSSSDDVVFTVNAAPPVNQAPVVNAGPDQTITLPAAANLSGTATDDGLPSGSTLTRTWSKVSGPGTVTFANPSSLATTASFSASGTYILRLTANDTVLSTSDDISIVVNPAAGGTSSPYTTNFPLTENPISEGGKWLNGKTNGLDWADVSTNSGLASGTQTGVFVNYNDSVALLSGTWGPDQTVQATVHSVNQSLNYFEEVELWLRGSMSAHSTSGYEITFRCSGDFNAGYMQIVRWNGPLNSYTYLNITGSGINGVKNGDVVKASISGNTIKVWVNGVQIGQATDSTYANGKPGMGFYLQGQTGVNSDYGFSSFTATDVP